MTKFIFRWIVDGYSSGEYSSLERAKRAAELIRYAVDLDDNYEILEETGKVVYDSRKEESE